MEKIKVCNDTIPQIELYSDHVSILRKGLTRDNRVDISFDLITAIEFTPPVLLIEGKLIFHAPGLSRTKYSVWVGLQNENDGKACIPIGKGEAVKEFYELCQETWTKYRQAKNTSPAPDSIADTLLKFKSLLDSGVITQQEFDEKKKELMG